jgi:DNA-binding NtrC family response regulator
MEKKKILIVDDEKPMRRLLAWTLQTRDYAIRTAETGFAALRHLEQHHCDLLITDYRMPEMDGLELIRLVRTRHPAVPILVVTGDAPFHDLIRNGATAFLAKPFDAYELLDMVKSILARDE